jgi:hypothetical protein
MIESPMRGLPRVGFTVVVAVSFLPPFSSLSRRRCERAEPLTCLETALKLLEGKPALFAESHTAPALADLTKAKPSFANSFVLRGLGFHLALDLAGVVGSLSALLLAFGPDEAAGQLELGPDEAEGQLELGPAEDDEQLELGPADEAEGQLEVGPADEADGQLELGLVLGLPVFATLTKFPVEDRARLVSL